MIVGRALVFVLATTVVVLSVVSLLLASRGTRTFVVPPEMAPGGFWVEGARASRGFYRDWGHYLASLALTATPATVDSRGEMLMRYIAPGEAESFRTRFEIGATRLKEIGGSTFFEADNISVRPDLGMISLDGMVATYVSGRIVSEERRVYALTLDIVDGRPIMKSFVETSPDDPFGVEGGVAR